MRVALLTTDTTHHAYFAWKFAEQRPLTAIVVETRAPTARFPTGHPFERLRDAYEREVLLAGFDGALGDIAPVTEVESANDSETSLRRLGVDVVLVFGTGKLLPRIIDAPGVACLNLHGGNPEEYRGLDTHLWAIYHNDFDNLVTTLHWVDEALDTGDLVASERLELHRGMEIHTLRSANAEVCVRLCLDALDGYERDGVFPAREQQRRGRYYSFMPAVLKDVCVTNFRRHVALL